MGKSNFFTPIFKKKLKDIILLSFGGVVTFCGVSAYTKNEHFYKNFVMPLFHYVDPENAHKLSIYILKYKPFRDARKSPSGLLESSVLGLKFENPLGVAAGFDKNGEAVDGLFRLGFGFVEVGSVTPRPQPGNPKPRVFRLPEVSGIINRYGFNSDGHDAVFERLSKLEPPGKRKGILGVNLGKNKDSTHNFNDFVLGVRKFGPIADYLVINISSPNTPGLRTLQEKEKLEALASAVIEERNSLPGSHKPAVLLKISPDLSDEDKKDIANVIMQEKCRMDGLIVSNTTVTRPAGINSKHINEVGGLSGQPLKDLSNTTLKAMSLLTKGKIPIIGVGGISNGRDAQERIYNGASLVQLYSALAYEGPPIVEIISNELEDLLREDGYSCVTEAVGARNSS